MATEAHELTAAYALDALGDDERAEYERHLASCERCQAELVELWVATDALALAASGPEPSGELRGRIMDAARAERRVVVPFVSHRSRAVPALAAAAALAALVALAVGIWGARVSSDLDETRQALARERTAAAVLADPGARELGLQAGDGAVVVSPDGRAVVVLRGLDAAPAGKTYQLWIVPRGDIAAAISGGVFAGEEPTDVELVEGRVSRGDLVAVTLERRGGAARPTTRPLAASQPA